MNKKNRTLAICLLSSIILGCTTLLPTKAPQPTVTPQLTTRRPQATRLPAITFTPTKAFQPTATLLASKTPSSTSKPKATAKVQSTATLANLDKTDLMKSEGGGAAMWLPEDYLYISGTDVENDFYMRSEFDDDITAIKDLDLTVEPITQMLEQNPSLFNSSIFPILGFNSKYEFGNPGISTLIAAAPIKTSPDMDVKDYLDAAIKQLPPQFQVIKQETTSLQGRQAERLIVDFTILDYSGRELLYVLQDGDTLWVIVRATGAEDFEQQLPVFERSVLTFTIIKP